MATATRTLQANVFKRVYNDKNIHDALAQHSALYAKLMDSGNGRGIQYEGEYFCYPVHYGGSAAGHQITETGTLPTADRQKKDWLKFNMTQYARTIELSTRLIEGSQGKEAAIVNELDDEAARALNDAKHDLAIGFYLPMNGVVTRCKAATSTTVFEVQHPERLREGETIAVATAAEVVTHGIASTGTKITDITEAGVVTVETALSGTPASSWVIDGNGLADYYVYRIKEYKQGIGCFGLEDLINTTNSDAFDGNAVTNGIKFGLVDRTTAGTRWARGTVLDLGGVQIDDRAAHRAATKVSTRGRGSVTYWICHPDVFEDILDAQTDKRRFGKGVKVAGNWFETATLANRPVFADPACPPTTIYGLDERRVWIACERRLGWEKRDGSWLHRLENQLVYRAVMHMTYQLCGYPDCHVKIINVASTTYS